MGYKRYGFNQAATVDLGGARYAEFRMMSAVLGASLALIFANPGLVLWVMLFFALGLMAEGLGKTAMQIAIGCAGILIVFSLVNFSASGLVFGGIALALAFDAQKSNII